MFRPPSPLSALLQEHLIGLVFFILHTDDKITILDHIIDCVNTLLKKKTQKIIINKVFLEPEKYSSINCHNIYSLHFIFCL